MPAPRHLAPPQPAADTQVVTVTPEGPVFPDTPAVVRSSRPATFGWLLGTRDRVTVGLLTAGWLTALVAFWAWWFRPERLVTWPGLVLNSALLLYLAIVPGYFMLAVNRLRGVSSQLPVPDVRVAFVVTKAPSEPWPVARATLEAMLAQDFPGAYDVWLCDEDPSESTAAWCRTRDVRVASRRGVPHYHRPHWPRRTRCKEGNLSWFYDNWGYADYDVVAQLDCDHVPGPTYLAEMVRPFADPAIGYVAAPSICDRNAASSWAARGRLFCEATFHGPFQTGHQRGMAPLSIGSHYAVRTVAVRDIGGVGPELAEDFSTSFLMTSAGWEGAFAHRAEAHGDGPHGFAAMVTQEFQWSRSLVTLLFGLVPRHLGRLAWRLRARFAFALSFYPLMVTTMALGLLLPPVAAVTGLPWVDADYVDFLLRWASVSVWLLAVTALLRRRGLLRPRQAPLLSWENWLYVLARWPWIGRGVLAAGLQRARPRQVGFAVTPKSRDGLEPLPTRLVLPYLAITVGLSTAALVGEVSTRAVGYVFLCLLGSLTYAVVSLAVPLLHAREAARALGVPTSSAVRRTVAVPVTAAVAALVPLGTAIALFPPYVTAVLGW
ncbi:glycosyltransferase family 2 protein [Geodermatophilus africanus]|uniref:glycosyltransferase family 2 protein n=1 Tax=Geodermatophilus africanus TaxID=1137993 RepID=UPI001B8D9375|nr:glycosyltransferase family 2 protein [Geodermatophilus africanus]